MRTTRNNLSVLVLAKQGEHYMFFYDKRRHAELRGVLGRYASNPESELYLV